MADAGTIDVHTHPIPPFLREALLAAGRSPSLSGFPGWSPDLALQFMDDFGIGKSIVSVSTPGVHFGDDAAAGALARRYNEYCTGLRERHPGRFGSFAALPLPDVDGSCREAGYALDVLKVDGVGLLASYGDEFLGAPAFEPLMAELDARGALVFVHPAGHPSSRALTTGYPLWMVEYPVDTTRAAVNLIMTGTTRRYPRIRFILAHNGGTLPFLAWRLSAAPLIDTRYGHMDEAGIRAEIARFYYEIAQSPGPEAFGSLLAVTSPDHILFGTDWPYCSPKVVQHLELSFRSLDLDDATRAAVRHGNAARFKTARV